MLVFVAAQASLWWEWRLLLVAVCGLLVTVGALVAEHRLQALWASLLAVLGLSSRRAQAQESWCTGFAAPWHVGSSQTHD